jgi:hypothetical protein
MSILRHFNKHQGWNDGKRTYNGGGGGLGNFFAEIDPVEAFKGAANSTADEGFRQTDWMSENGWILPVAMITAGVANGALGAEVLTAEGGVAAGSAELAGPSLAGSQAFDAAIASGASTAEAAAAADAAAQAAINAGQGIGTATGASAGTAATQALPYTEAFDAANLASNGSNAASIAQNLTATGMDSFLAQDMANLAAQGLSSAQIASTLAASYTPAELAGTGIQSLNWSPASGTSFVDALKTANQVRQGASTLSKLLSSGSQFGGKQLAGATQNLAQGQTKVPMAMPALIRGNQNPFVMTQNLPIQNKKTDLTSLAELLKQG